MNDSSLKRGKIETDWHKLYRNTLTHSAVKNLILASLIVLTDDGMLKLIPSVSISIMNLVVFRQFLIDAGYDTIQYR